MELSFVAGGGMRKVIINKRKVSILTPENNFVPITLDLDKLDSTEFEETIKRTKMSREEVETLHKLSKLNDENLIAKDIITDWQKIGWRCVMRKA